MEYRKLGKWGIKVSNIGLGSYLTIGMHVDDEVSKQCVKTAFDAGINFFDTANAYNRGQAEAVLGRCLADYPRESFVLATKVWAPMGDGPNDRGLSAKHIKEQCEASLRRLGVDYVDLYQFHRPDPDTPVEESVRAVEDLCRQGKVLYWGTSEWSGSQITEAVAAARQLGLRPPASNQPRYSLMYRYPEAEVFPVCLAHGIGQVVFSPLAHGVLTGKYEPGQPPPPDTRAADKSQNAILMDMYWGDDKLSKVKTAAGMARDLGLTCAQLALAWVLRQSVLSSAIIGATKPAQIEQNAKASDARLPQDVVDKLDELFPAPPERPGP